MRSEKYYKIATRIGLMGLVLLAIVILSNSAYPSMVFRILAPLGLLLVFISVGLCGISWLLGFKESIKKKDYISAVIIIVTGVLFILRLIYNIV